MSVDLRWINGLNAPEMIAGLNKFLYGVSRLSAVARDSAVATIYPSRCRACGDCVESWRDGVACPECWREIEQESVAGNFCSKCWTRLRPPGPAVEPAFEPAFGFDDRRCGRCDQFAFSSVRACGPYEGALRESVLWLKLHPHFPARLRDWLRRTFASLPDSHLIESIIPTPLSADRRAERGFNQAEIIARELASLSGLRMDLTALVRVKKTERHRAGMGARERASSLEQAFRIRAPRLVDGRVLLLVDDVITTGATANEIARVLLGGGARAVNVLTLARAMNEFSQ